MNWEEKHLWERVLRGEVDIEDSEVVAMAARSHTFSVEVEKLRHVQTELAGAQRDMIQILEEARQAPVLDKDRRLLEHIPELTSKTSHAPWLWGKRSKLSALAALLVAVLGFAWYQNSGSREAQNPGPVLGGSAAITLVAPKEGATSLEHFEWQGELEFGSWYVVHVLDLETQEEVTSPRLSSHQWNPATPLTARHVRWFVVLHSPSGTEPVVSPALEVSL
ncbi:MAG: hypothetical protein H6830_01610 [Planctomycetes bacterium]|nr:hypothetical protein [Planctomycetota bacterium]MCB9910339.1 hypothetical protein [Planctomycetota bacterium]MCB9912050.1 hypothetical protein [Planctomycetota bacterium]HPF13507.1 hypothetical protein [Planctomycetota bacterium]HRV82171.1 hypothetical protein [Planctomycetota bacterium]